MEDAEIEREQAQREAELREELAEAFIFSMDVIENLDELMQQRNPVLLRSLEILDERNTDKARRMRARMARMNGERVDDVNAEVESTEAMEVEVVDNIRVENTDDTDNVDDNTNVEVEVKDTDRIVEIEAAV